MVDFERVALVDVSRHFLRRRAVSRASLSVRRGEVVGLLGPNGAGKSTLIGMLATLTAPTSGSVLYDDLPARQHGPAVRRQIGLLAHDLHLYPELTARQNLTLFARLYGLAGGAEVDSALSAAGLMDRADDEVSGFSRGMRQRLALERALLHRPRLLLLDEPFTGLDDRAVGSVTERIRRAAAEGGIVVVATHDLDVAAGLLTRAVVLRDGRLVADEAAEADLRGRYRALVGSA